MPIRIIAIRPGQKGDVTGSGSRPHREFQGRPFSRPCGLLSDSSDPLDHYVLQLHGNTFADNGLNATDQGGDRACTEDASLDSPATLKTKHTFAQPIVTSRRINLQVLWSGSCRIRGQASAAYSTKGMPWARSQSRAIFLNASSRKRYQSCWMPRRRTVSLKYRNAPRPWSAVSNSSLASSSSKE